MRNALHSLLLLPILATPVVADEKASIDLVASFLLGIEDGSIFGSLGPSTSLMTETSPGVFEGTVSDGTTFSFTVVDKGNCVFDINFIEAEAFALGLLLDGKQLKSASYEKTGAHDGVFDYTISLIGGADMIVELGPTGERMQFSPNAPLTTSLTAEHMRESLTAFQRSYCPAAS